MAAQNTSSVNTNSFDKNLNEDIKDFHLQKNSWTQARNAINNSSTGDLGDLGNEPANLFCTKAPYTIIGAIHLFADKWTIFSTDNVNSEIGLFEEETCKYRTIVNDVCLSLQQTNLIKGESKENSDCTWQIYWADGLNVDRTMCIGQPSDWPDNPILLWPCVSWVQSCVTVNNCLICEDTPVLDCDQTRLARFVKHPCIHIEKGANGGTLPNGSYFVTAAYVINGQRVTDYFGPSNVQSLFEHDNVSGSIDIVIDDADLLHFDEMEIVVVSIVNQQVVARRLGLYSVRTKRITLDIIDNSLPVIDISLIPIRNPVMDKSDAMYNVGDYLIRVGPTSKLDFNYQPLANQIVTKWVSVEYPADYYRKGGNETGHMRDEIYPFFIRWVYDTGDRSASYHIPGRAPFATDLLVVGGPDSAPEIADGLVPFAWRVNNTAIVTTIFPPGVFAPDGVGQLLSEGYMGYWESEENYDDNRPDIWNAGVVVPPYPGTNPIDYDLCGNPIRHHRFPDNALHPTTNHFNVGGSTIRIMGVRFDNILPPVDNAGNVITSIVGYEILRGNRDGNRSVIAKGIINNMGLYTIPGGVTPRTGAYPNYPYNDLNPDVFLSTTPTSWAGCAFLGLGGGGESGYTPQSMFARDLFSFHSPETNFSNPFLSTREIKVYGEFVSSVTGKFEYPSQHPKFKIITNLSFFVSAIAGIGIASLAINGDRRVTRVPPINPGYSYIAPAIGGIQPNPATYIPAAAALGTFYSTAIPAVDGATTGGAILTQNFLGLSSSAAYGTYDGAAGGMQVFPDLQTGYPRFEQSDGQFTYVPALLRVLQVIPTFTYYWSEGVDTTLRLIKSIIRYRDFALQYHSHGFYSSFLVPTPGNQRRVINELAYMDPHITDFGTGYRINNLYRNRTVVVNTAANIGDPGVIDNTRRRASDVPALYDFDPYFGGLRLKDPTKESFSTTSSCHYVALKQRLRNQYGQIDAIKQIPVSTCVNYNPPVVVAGAPFPESIVMFNGDIYIGRYTEKNTFFFFYDWLYGQPDGFEYDYYKRKMLLFPRYWLNSESFEASDFLGSFLSSPFAPAAWIMPNDFYALDGLNCSGLFPFNQPFSVRNAYYYLFCSGVRDFFVESEINVDLRDWGNGDAERHYDPYRYTDTKSMFDVAIIKSGNFYKYDISLSKSKTWINFLSWSNVQAHDYDPRVAQTCFVYKPNRVIYSLPQQTELIRDNWQIFLPNNYKDFKSRVTSIKSVNKSGALILFQTQSPIQFQGLDQLQTDLGTKLTIGDGGLFSQPVQNLINSDSSYEYGSCQDRLSVINTPAGLFWISQNQGKIFQLQAGINEITLGDLKWWFAAYLPYKLTEQFPEFELKDNPVIGIGCQSIYDNENGLVYFTKKDFIVRTDILDTVTYVSADDFLVNGALRVKLGDPRYFEDASWTVSFDPKTKGWISYHDWHPDLLLPGKNTFMSISRSAIDPTQTNGIWIHNKRCDRFCNYYGEDFPFEVEFRVNTIQTVNTLRSVEYQLETYRYDDNCFDRFHVLDFNFDEATIYNTEQCSGLLRLNLTPKNNAPQIVQYPQINPTNIDILYSKEEQKYRFNQFWDITDSRGEFPIGSVYPPPTPNVGSFAERMIWNTGANGYVRTLNSNNLNYNKNQFERKKFRHYTNTILLRRRICGDRKMLVLLANTKNLVSQR